MSNETKMEFHEIANIFPLMEGTEFETLIKDIKENGLIEPIYLFEGKIIDGRNRYLACQEAGIEPRFEEYTGTAPIKFVVSKNLHRRHLNESQRGVIASKLANMPQGARTDLPQICGKLSQPEASELMNVSPRTIQTVKAVEREAPELIEQIAKGEMTAHEALKQVKKKKREEERAKIADEGKMVEPSEGWNIIQGDIRTVELNKQYDFIITDPPYSKEYLDLYEVLAKRSVEWLKDDGLLVVMCGQSYVNQIYKIFDEYLTYYWTGCYLTPKQPTPLRQRQVNTTWKPILIYAKKEGYKGKTFGDVFYSEKSDKEYHEWGQSVSGMSSIVKQMCVCGQSILDPFCGSGSTGIASLQNGCLFDGIDIDTEAVNIAKGRLASFLSESSSEGVI